MRRFGIAAGLLLVCLSAWAGPAGLNKPLAYDDPRTVVAISDMRNMADALEACAIKTTYYVSLEALNDGSTPNAFRPWDDINNGGGSFVIRPSEGRFRPDRINLLTAYNAWNGPLYQLSERSSGRHPLRSGVAAGPLGQPLLPLHPRWAWRAATPARSPWSSTATGSPTVTTSFSLGPDGIMSADDLAWSFGVAINVQALTSLRGVYVKMDPLKSTFSAPAGAALTVRGRNLGAGPSQRQSFF